MKIIKVFNNNTVATVAEDKTEMVVTGSGIGFKKKIGDIIDVEKIEKKYIIDNFEKNKLYRILQNTPLEYLEISESIYDRACEVIGQKLGNQMIIFLTDHISFAIEREKKNIKMPNLLLSEIKTLYRKEYRIGVWALEHIFEKTGILLPEDEAGYIAMHIVNSQVGGNQGVASEIINISKEIIEIVKSTFSINIDDDDFDCIRFKTHLKYLAKRVLNNDSSYVISNMDENFYQMVLEKNKNMQKCIKKIKEFILDNYEYEVSKQESFYVMIHILKLID